MIALSPANHNDYRRRRRRRRRRRTITTTAITTTTAATTTTKTNNKSNNNMIDSKTSLYLILEKKKFLLTMFAELLNLAYNNDDNTEHDPDQTKMHTRIGRAIPMHYLSVSSILILTKKGPDVDELSEDTSLWSLDGCVAEDRNTPHHHCHHHQHTTPPLPSSSTHHTTTVIIIKVRTSYIVVRL